VRESIGEKKTAAAPQIKYSQIPASVTGSDHLKPVLPTIEKDQLARLDYRLIFCAPRIERSGPAE
jgi:hypothetical protein